LSKANSHSELFVFQSEMHIPQNIYAQIVRLMPIPCVDLLVKDEDGSVLLIKRANEPAKGQWWFPGGRVHFLETREQAAKRKLKEECGLEAFQMKEIGTYDVILDMFGDEKPRHGITSLFYVSVRKKAEIILDAQSLAAEWHLQEDWLKVNLHQFVRDNMVGAR